MLDCKRVLSRNIRKDVHPNRPTGADDGRAERKIKMLFKVTIKEIHKAVVDMEAESHDEALRLVEEDYWKNPNDYVLEPYDTFFE